MYAVLSLAAVLLSPAAWAQPAQDLDAVVRPAEPWRFAVALADGALMNASLLLTTRFLFEKDWAMIDSGGGLAVEGPRRWTWDDNEFVTNGLGHPYQGGFFYTAARANHLSYLEAVPVVSLVSWHWEWFHETEAPSINDQVTTSLSGPFFGEMMWRLSSQILDESAVGGRRIWRELAAGLLNPVRGFDRLLLGRTWHRGPPTLRVPLRQDLAFGMESTWHKDELVVRGARIHYELRYGDAYASHHLRRPLDFFDLHADISTGRIRGGPGAALYALGGLAGRRFRSLGTDASFFGLFQGAEFVQSPVSQVGSSSLGPGWRSRWQLDPRWQVELQATTMGVLMGAIDSPYALEEADRAYVMGPGAATQFQLRAQRHPGGHAFVEARGTWVRSLAPPLGDEFLGLARGGINVDLWRGLGVGGEFLRETRASRYDAYPDIDDATDSFMAHATWEL